MSAGLGVDLSRYVARAASAPSPRAEGRVREVVGVLVEVEGLSAPVGSQLEIRMADRRLPLEVLGFRSDCLLAAPLGPTDGVSVGMRVMLRSLAPMAMAGSALLGRIIDAFGRPLDGGPPIVCHDRVPLRAAPPPPVSRRPIRHALETGVRVVDALLPLGRGQRIGLFAGTGVGKSTLLGMLCRHARAEVMVVGLVGERGREVGDFVRVSLGREGLARTIVVAATSDMPPLVRARGALRATAIAEYFREQGKDVLLVMDSVTRFAMALREATLAAGEPPLTKGYTPSVFAALPALLERTGTSSARGSITAVYTVLVEGDDMNEPISDAVRGILDGHIVLSRKLANRGVFPAVDVLRSVSRLAPEICTKAQNDDVARVREHLAAYEDVADMLQIGAYVPGTDARADTAIASMPSIEQLVKQGVDDAVSRADSLQQLRRIAEERP